MTNPFKSSPRQIYSDEQLDSLSKNDTYRRKKRVADAVTWVFVVLIFAFGAFVVWWLLSDGDFRNSVKSTVLTNLVGIVVSGFVVIGFSLNKKQ